MSKKITITVPRDYRAGTRIEVDGVVGPGCQDLTRSMEQALGSDRDTELKDQHYQQRQDNEQQSSQGG